jgi:CRP-like cAMP-binding protein
MYILLEGTMEVVVDGKVVEVSQRGALLGEMAVVDQSPRGATLVARDPCKLAKLDERRFHRMVQQNPFFAAHVLQVFANRLRQMNQLLVELRKG